MLHVFNLDALSRVWLGDPATAIWAIICMGFPFIDAFAFLVYYGGLINIPTELFEAAEIDGSNGWWNFTRIHLPLISPQMKMLIILSFIGSVQNFTPILILTNGGPGKEVLYLVVISMMMIPQILTLTPLYRLMQDLGLKNNWLALVLPWITGGQVFGIILCRTFIMEQPASIFESARIDGATEFEAYYKIAVSLAKPILATVAIINIISLWLKTLY